MGNTESATDPDAPPWFTHGLGSPPFTTIADKESYQIRKYQPSKWVGTEVKSRSCKDASNTSFWRLFKYISGENATKQKIPMTTPVSVKVPGQNGERTFTTHFYIPVEFQADTPAPTNPDVSFYECPECTVYVISYSGFTSDDKLLQYATQLGTLLDRDGVDYVKEHYFYCGYDPPYRLFNRHNEVWFLGAPMQVTESTENYVSENEGDKNKVEETGTAGETISNETKSSKTETADTKTELNDTETTSAASDTKTETADTETTSAASDTKTEIADTETTSAAADTKTEIADTETTEGTSVGADPKNAEGTKTNESEMNEKVKAENSD